MMGADFDAPAAQDAAFRIHLQPELPVKREHFLRTYAYAGTTVHAFALVECDLLFEKSDGCTQVRQFVLDDMA